MKIPKSHNNQMASQFSTKASALRNQRMKYLRAAVKQMPIVSQKTNSIKARFQVQQRTSKDFMLANSLMEEVDSTSEHLSSDESGNYTYNSFLDKYNLLGKLGEGGNASVHKCIHKTSGKIYAMKKFQFQEQHIIELKKSFINLKELNHPSVVKTRALYFDRRNAYLVMQYLSDPNLSEYTIKDENELKHIIREIIAAVRYIHQHNICHRDIKPENILYCSREKRVKIIDFGICKKTFLRGSRRDMLTIIGTHFYLAPEVFLGGGYDERVDLWALGVTIYRLIAGYTPFESEYHSDTIANIMKGEVKFDDRIWNKYSPFAKDFVNRLLKSQQERMSLSEAQKHIFIGHEGKKTRNRLSRYVTLNMQLNEAFHDQMNNKLRNALSREQGVSRNNDKLFKSINLIGVNQYDLQDSDDEQFIVSPLSQSMNLNYKSFSDFTQNDAQFGCI